MNKLEEVEKEYCLKLQQAKKEENYDKIQNLFWELNVLRKFYKKGKFRKVISG
jgi:hypothetical protein